MDWCGVSTAVAAHSYINGNGVTASQIFDIGVGVALTALTVSNPVFLVGFGVYAALDAYGAFDDLKESVGGDTVVLKRDN